MLSSLSTRTNSSFWQSAVSAWIDRQTSQIMARSVSALKLNTQPSIRAVRGEYGNIINNRELVKKLAVTSSSLGFRSSMSSPLLSPCPPSPRPVPPPPTSLSSLPPRTHRGGTNLPNSLVVAEVISVQEDGLGLVRTLKIRDASIV